MSKLTHSNRLLQGLLLTTAIFSTLGSVLKAGDEKAMIRPSDDSKKMVSPMDVAPVSGSCAKDWTLELGSGAMFANVRSTSLDGYTQVPVNLTAGYKLDDVSLDNFAGGIFRGYTEFLFQGFYDNNLHSPGGEHNIFGVNAGPRYNFVQPGWKVVPFVQGLVGACFAESNSRVDASGNAHGLGQDFNFTFGVGIGVRYDITESWYARLGAYYTHFSNAGLSEPGNANRAIDSAGPQLALGYQF